MSTDNFGSLGADFFIKTYNKGSTMSQADLDALVQYVQLTTTILAIGDFTPNEQDSVWMILERTDVNTAPGYTVTNNTDVTMTSGGLVTINSLPWNKITGKPSFFSGDYNDLTNKPTIPSEVDIGNFIFSAGDASLPASNTMTLSTFRSGANEESKLTLNPTGESSLYASGVLKLGTGYGSGSEQYWQFGANGNLTIPGDIVDSTGTSVLGGGITLPTDASGYLVNDGSGNLSWAAGDGTFSGDYNDLTNKPSIPDLTGYATEAWVNSQDFGSGGGSGATALSGLTDVALEGPIEGSVLTWNDSQQKWENRDIPVATQIANTEPSSPTIETPSTYSVSVGTDGVVTMVTARGVIEFGALPEVGGSSHLHIMRPAFQEGATDLFFGDDYNYVKLPAAYGSGTQGVEIGSSYGQGTVGVWRFGTDGHLTLPAGGDIKDSNGTSVLGGGSSFSGSYDDLTDKPTIPTDVSDLTDTTGLLGGGGGTTLPTNASGYLNNDGSGTLTWVPGNPSGAGALPYNEVVVFSNTVVGDWTAYTLSGTMDAFYDWNNSYTTITLSSEPAYGKQITPNTKRLWINDSKIDNKDYLVIEFPASPAVGDVFTVPMVSPTTTVNAGLFVVGETYTIISPGTTNWTAIGASYGGAGNSFVATGPGSGTGTASTSTGAKKVIFKPQSGARAQTMMQGNLGAVVFGQGGDYDFMYIDLSGQNSGNPVTWVYAGVIDSIPTWYQFYF